MADNPQTIARKTMAGLIREARSAGWGVLREAKPDLSMKIDASMADSDGNDDFSNTDLRMGGK